MQPSGQKVVDGGLYFNEQLRSQYLSLLLKGTCFDFPQGQTTVLRGPNCLLACIDVFALVSEWREAAAAKIEHASAPISGARSVGSAIWQSLLSSKSKVRALDDDRDRFDCYELAASFSPNDLRVNPIRYHDDPPRYDA